MKKISETNVIDIVPFKSGFIYVKKIPQDDGAFRVKFLGYDTKRMENAPVTKSVYLLSKFGPSFEIISEKLGDYATCDAGILANKYVVVVYPTGEMGIFDDRATLVWTGDLQYKEDLVQSLAVDGNNIWCCVPNQNSIIEYSIINKKVNMRIGGDNSTAFSNPVAIVRYDDELFVTNKDSCKVRIVSLKDYSVRDFRLFDEPVYRYIQTCGKEVVLLESGIYVL